MSTEQEEGTKAALQMEVLDEEQIVKETKGEVIEQYFYQLPSLGNRVALSWAGIKWVCYKMAQNGDPISVEEHYVVESTDGTSWLARAKAVNLKTREARWGYAEQKRFTVRKVAERDGTQDEFTPIPFAYVLAASKAQRNAMRAFVPEIVIQEAYKEWLEKNKKASHAPPK